MALATPHYIQAANLQDKNVRYPWDDWNEEQALEPIDDEFLARLKNISQRAIIAFTAATAEWIVHRFAGLADLSLPIQFLEAAWAMIIELRYCGATWEGYTKESEGWAGPVRRPIAIGMNKVHYTFEAITEYDDPETSGASLTNLAQYVLTDPAPYLKWRERVMKRLETLYPLNRADKLGEAVPREALDPEFDFRLEQTERLVNQFLASLAYRSNPFLNSPDKMLKQGFKGTPYVFDIEADRRNRPRRKTENQDENEQEQEERDE
jgi:hypothetical protein